MLERQAICFPCCFARANAGKSSAASMAIIAMTTSSSMRVKPFWDSNLLFDPARFRKPRFSSVFMWGTSADPFSASIRNFRSFNGTSRFGVCNFATIVGSGLHGETEASASRGELDRLHSANLAADFSQGPKQFNEKVILPLRRVGVLRIETDINYAQERVLPR